jgi:hypothetical protein
MSGTITDGKARARKLQADVLAYMTARPGQWLSHADLLHLAPQARITVYTEIDETPFGYDNAAGPAYDAGPSGKPDGAMLHDVLTRLRNELLIEDDGQYPRQWRVLDLGEFVGLGVIAARLKVQRNTVDQWRIRRVLPEPDPAHADGRRPRWPWAVIREFAIKTGRREAAARPDPLTTFTAMIWALTSNLTVDGPLPEGGNGTVWTGGYAGDAHGPDLARADMLLAEGGWRRTGDWSEKGGRWAHVERAD